MSLWFRICISYPYPCFIVIDFIEHESYYLLNGLIMFIAPQDVFAVRYYMQKIPNNNFSFLPREIFVVPFYKL